MRFFYGAEEIAGADLPLVKRLSMAERQNSTFDEGSLTLIAAGD